MDKIDKTILIIEDEEATLKVLVAKFKHEGFNVLEAKDGEEGLIIAMREKPELVLLDIIMPKMDGMAFLKELRKDSWGKTVPIIILTNLSDDKNIAEAMEGGVYDFLVKSSWETADIVKRAKERLGV
jgi:DNA-binding response OmpR family regulator